MAVAAAKITGVGDFVVGNKKWRTRRLTFTSNYADGGETIAPSLFGLRKIEAFMPHGGVAPAAALSTGCPVAYNSATGKLLFFDSAGDGDAMDQKPAEAYATNTFLDVTVVGV